MGSIDGVYASAAAWRGGHEVVSLLFDPQEVEYRTLVEKARQFKCTSQVYAYSKEQLATAKEIVGSKAVMADDSQRPRFAKGSDQKYHLANSPLRALPMNSFQMMKMNSAIARKEAYGSLLSPRQKELINKMAAKLQSDRNALDGFVAPADDNELGAYTAKLEKALQ